MNWLRLEIICWFLLFASGIMETFATLIESNFRKKAYNAGNLFETWLISISFIPHSCIPDKWTQWRYTAEPRGWTSSFSSFSAPFLCRWWWTLGLHRSKAREEPENQNSGYCFTCEQALYLRVTMVKYRRCSRQTKANLNHALFVMRQ